ncbi:hypothetical protein [Streptomyces sp. NPDC005732]|uniref:hypothetical protein n=1 Tax=Streptomyces sp. NPDC005732 TaxID=3157057 RepID=UPI003408FC96
MRDLAEVQLDRQQNALLVTIGTQQAKDPAGQWLYALQLLRLDDAGERDHHALGEVFSVTAAAGRGQDLRHDVGEVGGGFRRDDVGLLVRLELGELACQGRDTARMPSLPANAITRRAFVPAGGY